MTQHTHITPPHRTSSAAEERGRVRTSHYDATRQPEAEVEEKTRHLQGPCTLLVCAWLHVVRWIAGHACCIRSGLRAGTSAVWTSHAHFPLPCLDSGGVPADDVELGSLPDMPAGEAAYLKQAGAEVLGSPRKGRSRQGHPMPASTWLAKASLAESRVVKVLPSACTHLGFHPTQAAWLLAAGDKRGNLALWHCREQGGLGGEARGCRLAMGGWAGKFGQFLSTAGTGMGEGASGGMTREVPSARTHTKWTCSARLGCCSRGRRHGGWIGAWHRFAAISPGLHLGAEMGGGRGHRPVHSFLRRLGAAAGPRHPARQAGRHLGRPRLFFF